MCTMLAGVFVVMGMLIRAVRVLVRVMMVVGMAVLVRVFMRVRHPIMRVLMGVGVAVNVRMRMIMFVFAFHVLPPSVFDASSGVNGREEICS